MSLTERCCGCSSEAANGHTWLNIFTDSRLGHKLMVLLEEVTGRQIKPMEDQPKRICPACWVAAKIALKFKQRFEKSLQYLREQNEPQTFDSEPEDDSYGSLSEEDVFAKTEKGLYKCSHCSKICTDKSKLIIHWRVHTGERPFKCTHCSRAFIQKGDLNRHNRIHTGERPFKCPHCSKSFSVSHYLKKHIEIHTGDKPFKCSHCSMSFKSSDHLKKHIQIHTGEKPFKCVHCSKDFDVKSHLTRHLLTHSDERPFKCSNCLMAYKDPSCLRIHIRKGKCKEKPFQCTQCPKRFRKKCGLKSHSRTHTEKESLENEEFIQELPLNQVTSGIK